MLIHNITVVNFQFMFVYNAIMDVDILYYCLQKYHRLINAVLIVVGLQTAE